MFFVNYVFSEPILVFLGIVLVLIYHRAMQPTVTRFAWSGPIEWVIAWFIAPVLWLWFKKIDKETAIQERSNRQLKQIEDERRIYNTRKNAIAKWKSENPPVVFYNTIDGITAVCRATDYRECVELTSKKRVDGLWDEKVLLPIRETFLFIHASSLSRVPERFRSGWVSDFNDLRKDVACERREDIFVPFVSDTHYDIGFQEMYFKASGSHSSGNLLIARHALLEFYVPKEVLQRIDAATMS